MTLNECYMALRLEGATSSQAHFSSYWCGMNPGYYRSGVQRPALEVLARIRGRLARLAASKRNLRLMALVDAIDRSINQRVGGQR